MVILIMDTDYFFLCPKCGKMTIGTGSGDMTDIVVCHDCGKMYKAYYLADIGSEINVHGKTVSGMLNRIYATESRWYNVLHKE